MRDMLGNTVVMGSFMDYRHAHPQTAALVVEVANSTLAYDRLKAIRYASHGIPEYWLVNLKENCIEVFQRSENGRYTSYRSLKVGSAFVCGNGKQVAVGSVLM
jgi:Uma2 family endonuclease